MAANNDSNPTPTTEQPRLLDANAPEAYALWQRRAGKPLYHFTQERTAWAITCPDCHQPRLLEVISDSEFGTYFVIEPCACGGAS